MSENVPWPKLRDYLLRVSTCRSLEECMRTACVEMQGVIPFDATTGIFRTSDNFNVAGFGETTDCAGSYNGYYRTLNPFFPRQIIEWGELDGEFVTDFQLPLRHFKSCRSVVAGSSAWISVVRSRRAPSFSDSDAATLAFIGDYLNHLLAALEKEPLSARGLSGQEIGQRFEGLTPREAEICSLVASRLSTAEIAARLFLSPRTVENHLANVFDKLDVRSREQLRYRLGVLPR